MRLITGPLTEHIYTFIDVPDAPSAPSITLKDYLLTASLDNLDSSVSLIQFEIVKDNATVFKTAQADVTNGHVEYSCYVDAGSEYKARCRVSQKGSKNMPFITDYLYSEWSEYSSNVSTIPLAPSGFTKCIAKTTTSV